MKKTVLSCVFAALALTFQAQISISPTNTQPHASAMLDVQSTNKGMLVPRMTTAQRNAINNPAKGLMVFDNNTNSFWYHNGTAWAAVGGSDVPASGIVFSETAVNANLSNAGFALIGQTQMVLTGSANSNNFAWTGQTNLTGAPSPRRGHSVIWTGNEMIIWGGSGSSGYLKDGGRYNPTTNLWQTIDTTSAPSARGWHIYVWTGTEMIVWGGYGSNNQQLNGSKYNPTSNTWTSIDTANAPTDVSIRAIWTGTEVLVWGSKFFLQNGQWQCLNTAKKYNPSTNIWTDISTVNAPTCRNEFSIIWTGTEMVIWGGYSYFGQTQFFNTGGRYNPATDTWTSISTVNAPDARGQHSAVWSGTDMIVYGGHANNPPLTSCGKYNPLSNSWTTIANSNLSNYGNLHGFWSGNKMVVIREDDGNGNDLTGEVYNPVSNIWTPLVYYFYPAPNARDSFSGVLGGDKIIIWGGNPFGGEDTNQGYILSPAELKTLYLFIKN